MLAYPVVVKNKSDKGPKKIVLPKSFVCWVGFICGLMFCVGTVFSLLDNEKLWVTIGFVCMLWLAIGMLYGWPGTIIIYDNFKGNLESPEKQFCHLMK